MLTIDRSVVSIPSLRRTSSLGRRVRRGLGAALVAIVLAAGARAQKLEDALAAFRAGKWSEAALVGANVPESSPDFAKAQYLLGETFLVVGDAANAADCFERVLARRAEAVPALVGLGRAQLALEKLDDAVTTLRRAVELDPKDARAHLALGRAQLAAKHEKEAQAEFESAFATAPKDPEVVRGWCEWLWSKNDDARAQKAAQDLAKALPKHPMGPFLDALCLERAGKDSAAIEAYEEALKRDDTFLDAHKNLAILCHTRNPIYSDAVRTQKSLDHYARYFALGGKDPELEQIYAQFKGFMDEFMKSSGGSRKGKGETGRDRR